MILKRKDAKCFYDLELDRLLIDRMQIPQHGGTSYSADRRYKGSACS